MVQDIETIGIADLFGPPSPAATAPMQDHAAASGIGFMAVRDFPGEAWLTPDRDGTIAAHLCPSRHGEAEIAALEFRPDQKNVYRGWFPLQDGRHL